jgi:hypothetical protein
LLASPCITGSAAVRKGNRDGMRMRNWRMTVRLSARSAFWMLVVGISVGIALLVYNQMFSALVDQSGISYPAEYIGWKVMAVTCSAFIILSLIVYLKSE